MLFIYHSVSPFGDYERGVVFWELSYQLSVTHRTGLSLCPENGEWVGEGRTASQPLKGQKTNEDDDLYRRRPTQSPLSACTIEQGQFRSGIYTWRPQRGGCSESWSFLHYLLEMKFAWHCSVLSFSMILSLGVKVCVNFYINCNSIFNHNW